MGKSAFKQAQIGLIDPSGLMKRARAVITVLNPEILVAQRVEQFEDELPMPNLMTAEPNEMARSRSAAIQSECTRPVHYRSSSDGR